MSGPDNHFRIINKNDSQQIIAKGLPDSPQGLDNGQLYKKTTEIDEDSVNVLAVK